MFIVIQLIGKSLIDAKVNEPNEQNSKWEPGGKGKNPVFARQEIVNTIFLDYALFIMFKI